MVDDAVTLDVRGDDEALCSLSGGRSSLEVDASEQVGSDLGVKTLCATTTIVPHDHGEWPILTDCDEGQDGITISGSI